jgi:hypothetical protein
MMKEEKEIKRQSVEGRIYQSSNDIHPGMQEINDCIYYDQYCWGKSSKKTADYVEGLLVVVYNKATCIMTFFFMKTK